jgi:hypothetical protein
METDAKPNINIEKGLPFVNIVEERSTREFFLESAHDEMQ